MVWRSQNPAIQIQTPLFRRVQWFLGRKQRKTHTSKAHFRKKLGEVLEFNNRFAKLGPGGLWHNNFHFLVLMLAACLELHRGTGRRHDYPGTWNIHLKKGLFPLDDEPNLYMGNGFFTKHSLKISCLGFQVYHSSYLYPPKDRVIYPIPRTIIRFVFSSKHQNIKPAGLGDTVDGQNPAPPRMMIIPLFTRFYVSQVVQDFFHQQYGLFCS